MDEDTWANRGPLGVRRVPEWLPAHARSAPHPVVGFPRELADRLGRSGWRPDQSFEILADYQQAYWFFLYLAGRLKAAGIGTANDQYLKDVAGLTKDPVNGIDRSCDADTGRRAIPLCANLERFPHRYAVWGTSDQTPWGSYISQYPAPRVLPIAPLDLGRMRRNLDFEGYDTPGAPPTAATILRSAGHRRSVPQRA